jgi:predicted TIM-barrel fold metal-dependent hydrolase
MVTETRASKVRAEPVLVVSSDGHAVGRMQDYGEYLDAQYRDDFKAYVAEYARSGIPAGSVESLRNRLDSYVVDWWEDNVIATGRLTAGWDPARRLKEVEREGVVAEVLFPDFGLPFEPTTPFVAARTGSPISSMPAHRIAGMRAHNRWLADFVATAPERFVGMARVDFSDPEQAVEDIREAHSRGLRGVVLPIVSDDAPLYDGRYEPIWSLLEELSMPLNSHVSLSSPFPVYPDPPHPQAYSALAACEVFFLSHRTLWILIWGGVLERHPELRVVFTEQQSDWVIDALLKLDHQWKNSFLAKSIYELVPRPPSEYWERQCFLGASLISRAEVAASAVIGVRKMMFGLDFPHHEGAWTYGTQRYLHEAFGGLGLPESQARAILGKNAMKFWNLDEVKLRRLAQRVGPLLEDIVSEPPERLLDRGDMLRPLASAVSSAALK